MGKYPTNINYFTEWSSNMAYILGYTISDGCLMKRNGNGYAIKYECSIKDEEIVQFIKNEISPTRPIRYFNKPCNTTNKTYPSIVLLITNQLLVNTLSDLGMQTRKRENLCMLLNCPERFKNDMLRGIIDADGCWSILENTRIRFEICSCCKNLMEDIKEYLSQFNIFLKIRYIDNITRIYTSQKENLIKIGQLIYNGNFCLTRKFEIFTKIKNAKQPVRLTNN